MDTSIIKSILHKIMELNSMFPQLYDDITRLQERIDNLNLEKNELNYKISEKIKIIKEFKIFLRSKQIFNSSTIHINDPFKKMEWVINENELDTTELSINDVLDFSDIDVYKRKHTNEFYLCCDSLSRKYTYGDNKSYEWYGQISNPLFSMNDKKHHGDARILCRLNGD